MPRIDVNRLYQPWLLGLVSSLALVLVMLAGVPASAQTCAGSCGGYGDGCYCDEACCTYNDCCPDKLAECGGCGPGASCGNGFCESGETCSTCSTDCGSCSTCGNGFCDGGETCSTCPTDCGACSTCGNGFCDNGETCSTCSTDCGSCCGNGVCSGGETCSTCPTDCGACSTCGNGVCSGGETCSTCPTDCGSCCGNGVCSGGETCSTCPTDCGSCCGNGVCSGGETCSTCPTDCGSCCGNGVCSGSETCSTCPTDCGSCSTCGNGVCSGGETCSTCPTDCGACGFCGNGICAGSETCANCASDCGSCCGNGLCDNGETACSCSTDCGTCVLCGNWSVDPGEQCDHGGVNSSTCDYDCTWAFCGDGLANSAAGEQCDDANTNNSDGCNNSCQSTGCDHDGIPEIQDDPGCDTCADPVSPPSAEICCTCGNGVCDFHEWWFATCDDNQPGVWIGVENCPTYCPSDCDQPGVPGTGGDLVCTPGETCEQDSACAGSACSFDWCGDGWCTGPETVATCPVDCGPDHCAEPESSDTCFESDATVDSGSTLDGRAAINGGPESNEPNTLDGCPDGTSGSYHSDESLDRLELRTLDGSPPGPGKQVEVTATVWAYTAYSSDFLDIYYAADASNPSWQLMATVSPTNAGANVLTAQFTLPSGGPVAAIRGQFRYGGSASSPCSSGGYNDRDDLIIEMCDCSGVVCGDGVCDDDFGEDPSSCATDCYCGDGVCSDGDEDGYSCPSDCTCGDESCTFQCPTSPATCLTYDQVCDGSWNCPSGEDEARCGTCESDADCPEILDAPDATHCSPIGSGGTGWCYSWNRDDWIGHGVPTYFCAVQEEGGGGGPAPPADCTNVDLRTIFEGAMPPQLGEFKITELRNRKNGIPHKAGKPHCAGELKWVTYTAKTVSMEMLCHDNTGPGFLGGYAWKGQLWITVNNDCTARVDQQAWTKGGISFGKYGGDGIVKSYVENSTIEIHTGWQSVGGDKLNPNDPMINRATKLGEKHVKVETGNMRATRRFPNPNMWLETEIYTIENGQFP